MTNDAAMLLTVLLLGTSCNPLLTSMYRTSGHCATPLQLCDQIEASKIKNTQHRCLTSASTKQPTNCWLWPYTPYLPYLGVCSLGYISGSGFEGLILATARNNPDCW